MYYVEIQYKDGKVSKFVTSTKKAAQEKINRVLRYDVDNAIASHYIIKIDTDILFRIN